MTGTGRKADKLINALITCRTLKQAAQAAGMSERSVHDYLNDPIFQERYRAAKDDVMRGVSNHLRGQMSAAVDVIADIMSDNENRPQDRLSAAKSILEYGARYVEEQEILERLKALEDSQGNK